jgi:DNA-directed RNA polymerase subunit RPC12/RpoP
MSEELVEKPGEAEEPEELVVLCCRCEDGPTLVYGSTKEKCADCGKEVWLSPGTRKTLEKAGPEYKILCIACGDRRIKENPKKDDKLMAPSLEQLKELLKHFGERN